MQIEIDQEIKITLLSGPTIKITVYEEEYELETGNTLHIPRIQ